MAYIVLADMLMREIFEKAAPHLRARGHRVDITVRAQELLHFVEQQEPDVLVYSGMLHGSSGWQVREELLTRYPNMKIKFIWIAATREDDGEPAYSWDMPEVSTFLSFPCSKWQIVLSVEQLIYRIVTNNNK